MWMASINIWHHNRIFFLFFIIAQCHYNEPIFGADFRFAIVYVFTLQNITFQTPFKINDNTWNVCSVRIDCPSSLFFLLRVQRHFCYKRQLTNKQHLLARNSNWWFFLLFIFILNIDWIKYWHTLTYTQCSNLFCLVVGCWVDL